MSALTSVLCRTTAWVKHNVARVFRTPPCRMAGSCRGPRFPTHQSFAITTDVSISSCCSASVDRSTQIYPYLLGTMFGLISTPCFSPRPLFSDSSPLRLVFVPSLSPSSVIYPSDCVHFAIFLPSFVVCYRLFPLFLVLPSGHPASQSPLIVSSFFVRSSFFPPPHSPSVHVAAALSLHQTT